LAQWLRKFEGLSDILAASRELFVQLRKATILGIVEEGAILVGPVHVGERSMVKANSILVGPVILGTGVTINYGVVIRDLSYIGSDCFGDCGSITTRSLILNRTVISGMADVNYSIIGEGCIIGARSTIGDHAGRTRRGTFIGHSVTLDAGFLMPGGSIVQ
jgi:UDP-N-acetylglucosamine diphosphorylase / glucose-1-phosphate thymidylyltransferase / UDP-N-acetylgalactosamine diphosphorylase / glucosamine-1-phosphate N-acetyltransferase / galactosamine-1-phosphate N-acetyltransferase